MEPRSRSPEPPSRRPLLAESEPDDVPACSVCGRQDETLRYTSLPYVFSFGIVTFRRAFSGVWCPLHRFPWAILAGLISTTMGWLGIPFGLVFTPPALYRLALGGEQPEWANAPLLRKLAEHRRQKGDVPGAARCLEALLQFEDDPAAREQLRTLYVTHRAFAPPPRPTLAVRVLLALLGAALVGLAAGVADLWLSDQISIVVGDEGDILGIALSWVPTVMPAYIGVLLVRRLVDWGVAGARCRSLALAVGVALTAALLASYGLPTGSAVYSYVIRADTEWLPLAGLQAVRAFAAVLTRGGALYVLDVIRMETVATIIYLVLILACTACHVAACLSVAVRAVRRQERLAEVESGVTPPEASSFAPGWAVLGGLLATLLLLFALSPQRSLVDHVEAQDSFWRGVDLAWEGQQGAALPHLERAVYLQPDWGLARLWLGEMYFGTGQMEEAAGEFKEAVRLAPDLPGAYSGLAQACEILGRPGEAVWLAREAVESYPDLSAPRKGLGFACLGQGDVPAAIQAFEAAIALDPDDAEAYEGLGIARYVVGAMDEALEPLRKALSLDPEDATACFYLGLALEWQGEFDDALGQYHRLAELAPQSSLPHARLATIYYDLDRPTSMETELERALELQDGSAFDHHTLGLVYDHLFRLEESEAEFLRAIELSPEAASYLDLGDLYLAQGRYEEALRACDTALELEQDMTDAMVTRALVRVAQGRLDDALDELAPALEVAPADWQVHDTLSFVHLRLGRVDDAVREAEEAVRLQRYSSSAQTSLALACQAQGRLDEAIAAAQEALKLSPRYDTPHYTLALCYLKQGRNEEAIAELQRYLELYRDRPLARDYRAHAEELLAELQ